MKSEKRILMLLLLFLLICGIVSAQQAVTLTTYYPAPRGDYETIRLVPSTPSGRDENDLCDLTTEAGLMYYQQSTNTILFCDGSAVPDPKWTSLGGERFWELEGGTDLYTQDRDNWRTGLGVTVVGAYRLNVVADPSLTAGIRAQGNVGIESRGVGDSTAVGIYAQGNGTGIRAVGDFIGVEGGTTSPNTEIGVWGRGNDFGVVAGKLVDHTNPNIGVWSMGLTEAVHAEIDPSAPAPNNVGVHALAGNVGLHGIIIPARTSPSTATSFAVRGEGGDYGVWGSGTDVGLYAEVAPGTTTSDTSAMRAVNLAATSGAYAIRAAADPGDGLWVSGQDVGVLADTLNPAGLAGWFEGNVRVDGDVDINGNVDVSGTINKSALGFVQPHPRDPSKEFHYLVLEGRESRLFFDGTATLQKGVAEIIVPEDFRLVTSPENLNVILTPFGETEGLYVKERSLQKIVVKEKNNGASNVSFGYMILGTRKGFEAARPVQKNTHFRPGAFTTQEDFEERFDLNEEDYYSHAALKLNRDLLISNGILHQDGKVNLKTASRMKWEFSKEAPLFSKGELR